jgi:uncharacterized membrane protein YbhN (UPF0104 family)
MRWKLLLPDKFKITKLFSLYMIGAFFSSFLPGVVGGDAVKAYYLNKDAKKISLTLASIFMDRYIGYVGLIIIGALAFPFVLGYFGESVYRWTLPFIFVFFIIGSFLFFGLQLGKRFRVISEFYEYFSLLKTKKHIVISALMLAFIIQLMNYLIVIILASGMGEKIPLLVLFAFLLPISIAGLGVREGSFVLLLGLIGVEPEVSTSLSLAWFFCVFFGSLPGLVLYLKGTSNTGSV